MDVLSREHRHAISRAFWSDHLEGYELVSQLACERAPTDSCYVCLYCPSTDGLNFVYNFDEGVVESAATTTLGNGPTSIAIRTQKRFSYAVAEDAGDWRGVRFGPRRRISQSVIHEPMTSDIPPGHHPIIGVLSFQSYTPHAFTPAFDAWTSEVANLLGTLHVVWSMREGFFSAIRQTKATAEQLNSGVMRIGERAQDLQKKIIEGASTEAISQEVLALARRLATLPVVDLNELPRIPVQPVPNPILSCLSDKEREVAMRISLPSKTIANQLKLSEHTVAFHLRAVYRKLNVSSKAEAAALLGQWPTY